MRRRIKSSGLTVNIIAGSYVVFFGLDLAKPKRTAFRGFGFKRFEAATGEIIWLRGMMESERRAGQASQPRLSCDQRLQA